MKRTILTWLYLCLLLPALAGAQGLSVTPLQTDENGITWYDATSSHNGPGSTTLRVLSPTSAPSHVPHRFIYVLPIIGGVDLQNEFGDGLQEIHALNLHNDYNAHIIAPSFQATPWYANHDSDPARQYESFLVQHLVPWVQANLGVTGQEEHWLVGFSKSGFGAVTLLMRNPSVFAAGAAWDFPADQANTSAFDMLANYGTENNFQSNYRLTSEWIAERREPFQTAARLWLSEDHATYFGDPTFRDDVLAFAQRLQDNDVQFAMTGGETRTHSWTSGWLSEAVAGLHAMRYSALDDFDRADGALGPNWVRDLAWGTGTAILGGQIQAPPSDGGAHYWSASTVGPDQYSQVTLTGDIGDWTGVAVRASASPSQGYWAAVKPDGVYLYSYVGGLFYQLVHDPTPWATGDVLRLEVRTVAAGTARLTVYRNGSLLFTVDNADHFIADGQPGIGLYASASVALDAWRGGKIFPQQPASSVQDDFNRANGELGASWVRDPAWGTGSAITGNQVQAPPFDGGAHYWNASSVGADQYSQITLTGTIGDWTGVAVRASVSPAQGYWAAVKSDGAYLYSLVNGDFYQLVYNPTPWATGDVLRLEVRTVAPGTARLTVYRNGSILFTVDDADHFIADGQPGFGLYASTSVALDAWRGGKATPGLQLPHDDFNRPDGGLGSQWIQDFAWGNGTAIAGNQVQSPLSNGGAHYWNASAAGADQYSQVTLTGVIGDWAGVVVRAGVSPAQGYWAAVKPDGLYLYSYVNGAFHQLAHDATPWATGDVLRLEVRTVAASTARLTAYRNGSLLFTVDDASHFIPNGQPGFGLYASTNVAIDDWEGGKLNSSPGDNFNRENGDLGPAWIRDPAWGSGTAIAGNQVQSPLSNGGAHYWNASAAGADQYSQVTLTGVIGDWAGVVVRAGVSPAQGYWAAVKPDGLYLYSYVNGAFHQLAHDATPWATGDVLRLEVRTVAASTARLTAYRNGSLLFTVDDASHFIPNGQPGFGLYASTNIAIDDWEGGKLPATP